MIRQKLDRISRETNRSYDTSLARAKILAPVMEGITPNERLNNACDMILARLQQQANVFQNVNFKVLYEDIL